MARNYKRLGGIINASVGPAKARAVFAESFGILRKNVVNLRENPVSSQETAALQAAQGQPKSAFEEPCKYFDSNHDCISFVRSANMLVFWGELHVTHTDSTEKFVPHCIFRILRNAFGIKEQCRP